MWRRRGWLIGSMMRRGWWDFLWRRGKWVETMRMIGCSVDIWIKWWSMVFPMEEKVINVPMEEKVEDHHMK